MNQDRDMRLWVYDGEYGIEWNWKLNNGLWTETDEKTYLNQLECVPPARMRSSAFVVGECYTENLYATFVKVDNRYFGKLCNLYFFDKEDYEGQIKKQFDIE